MKLLKAILMTVCMAFLCVAAHAAEAKNITATEELKDVSNQLIARLNEDKTEIKQHTSVIIEIVDTIIMPVTDFDLIAKRVLGRHWRDASAEQQKTFMKEFKLLLIVTYMAAFRSYENQSVVFKGERADPNDPNRVEVRTLIQETGAPPIPVNYRLHKVNGHWLVYDFNVDGVGLTSSFRAQFDEAIQQKGMDVMLVDMHKKNEKVFGKE